MLIHVDLFHEGKKPFSCTLCNSKFTVNQSLKYHISSEHEEKKPPKPYRCEICDKNFQSKGKLKEHISSIHDKRKPFACNICPAKFF